MGLKFGQVFYWVITNLGLGATFMMLDSKSVVPVWLGNIAPTVIDQSEIQLFESLSAATYDIPVFVVFFWIIFGEAMVIAGAKFGPENGELSRLIGKVARYDNMFLAAAFSEFSAKLRVINGCIGLGILLSFDGALSAVFSWSWSPLMSTLFGLLIAFLAWALCRSLLRDFNTTIECFRCQE
ncbi:MAG: hypothetical protein GVY31_07575 [Alphaproteobacteria bacterium]|jgi:hypothetical protein|nr:hypothetical protein [Alphaproteobacteria bacterium]